jgi:hypothetical protein
VIFIPCQSAVPRTWVGTGLTPPADAAASAAAASAGFVVGQAGMVMPGMLPQLAIGLADELGLAAPEPFVAALALHPVASSAATAAAAIGAAARPSGRRNRLSVGI